MKKFRLKIGVDVDGVLLRCFDYACEKLKLDYTKHKGYELKGTEYEPVLELFESASFVKTQPAYKDARKFIEELQKKAEVFIITAVPPSVMTARASSIMKNFPSIPKENIIIGTRKEIVNVDILLDDCPDNITSSTSAYPVLMRRNWNTNMTGGLSVNNYDEFLTLVDTIIDGYSKEPDESANKLYCLVGPSGSGKTSICNQMIKDGIATKVLSYTTRDKRDGEVDGIDYHFIKHLEFISKREKGFFCETSSYAGNFYGSSYEDVEAALSSNNVVMVLDICGAIAMKRYFKNTVLVFVKRDKKSIISSILNRNCSIEDKTNRIISLSDEFKNEVFADIIINNNGKLSDIVKTNFS